MPRATLVPCALVPPEVLYEVLNLGGGAAFWRTRGRTVSMDVFRQLLMGEDEASFGVVDADADGRVVGHVGLYNCDRISGVASVAAFFDQRLVAPELVAASAIRRFLDYVFDVLGLRKIHIEMPVANLGTLRQVMDRLGVVRAEGVFKAHTKIGSGYYDMQQLAVWAEDYREFRNREGYRASSGDSGDDPFAQLRDALVEMGYGPAEMLFGGTRLIEDLGLDSLALVELMSVLESVVGGSVDTEGMSAEVCIQDLVELVDAEHRKRLSASEPADP